MAQQHQLHQTGKVPACAGASLQLSSTSLLKHGGQGSKNEYTLLAGQNPSIPSQHAPLGPMLSTSMDVGLLLD